MPTCMIRHPNPDTPCGQPATGSYVHPVVGKTVHHCDTHKPVTQAVSP